LATIAKDLNDKTKARTGTSFMNGLTSVVPRAGGRLQHDATAQVLGIAEAGEEAA
jgi:hypothetical protein